MMLPVPMLSSPASPSAPSSGARMVSTSGRVLPLRGTRVRADARGGLARVTLEQRFGNPHAETLTVSYSLPLPHDAAVSGFGFEIGERRVVGEVDRRRAARRRYERALEEGRSAALLEQERGSLFSQEVGNIPPGAEIVVTVTLDQKLRWLDEGAWEWRFPTVVGPRYLGAAGRVKNAARIAQEVSAEGVTARAELELSLRDRLASGRRPESPSHAIRASEAFGALRVGFDGEATLDRDLVVRWAVAELAAGAFLDAGRPEAERPISRSAFGLLTLVPPARGEQRDGSYLEAPLPTPRDLVLLLDASGSMAGEPMAQAKRIAAALLDTLTARDRIELLSFGSTTRRFRPEPVFADAAAKREAEAWLEAVRVDGATEMRQAILEALRPRRDEAQLQVVLMTDGYVGFEEEIVEAIASRLPRGSRVHTVGVGSAVNRSLTGPAARAGRGVEVVVGLGEDAERAAERLLRRTDAPLVVDLELSGDALLAHAPRALPDLYAGAPACISVALRPEGGFLLVRGRTASGDWETRLRVPALAPGEGSQAVASLFGREAAEDLEVSVAAGTPRSAVDPELERLGLDFGIATRLTSWVAVDRVVSVDPEGPFRRERMPHALPHGVSAEGLGLRPAASIAAHPGPAASLAMPAYASDLAEDEDEEMPTTVASAASYGAPAGRASAGYGYPAVAPMPAPAMPRPAAPPQGAYSAAPPAPREALGYAAPSPAKRRRGPGLLVALLVALVVLAALAYVLVRFFLG